MTATSARPTAAAPATAPAVRIGILVGTVALAVALNAIIAAIGVAAGASPSYAPLTFPVFTAFTVVPITVGWFAWRFVARRAHHPQRTLTVLALVVLALSFIPDVVLLATGFIPGTTTAGVLALMAMHVVVIAVAVAGYTLASRR